MNKTYKIPFAYNEQGQVIDISSAVKGQEYKCSCGSVVKLRGGDVISNHFYHINEVGCSLESAIHKAYKDVFKRIKSIKLPYKVFGEDVLTFDRVELEKKVRDFIPDAIGYKDGTKYLVEFAKTSYIGERKKNKIKKANLFCIEIDINKDVKTIEDIEDSIMESAYREVIHRPEYKDDRELRGKFVKAYNKLKFESNKEINILRRKLEITEAELNRERQAKDLITQDRSLYFKKQCSNGASMFWVDIDDPDFILNGRIVAFLQGNKINLQFKTRAEIMNYKRFKRVLQ